MIKQFEDEVVSRLGKIRITDLSGYNAKIEINGIDVSAMCTGFDIHSTPNEPAVVTIKLIGNIEVEGDDLAIVIDTT